MSPSLGTQIHHAIREGISFYVRREWHQTDRGYWYSVESNSYSQPEQSEVKSKTKDHSDQEDLQANDITEEDIELKQQIEARALKFNEDKNKTKIPLHPDALS